jgi:hypothetical protein
MNKGLRISTLKMLSSKNIDSSINTIKNINKNNKNNENNNLISSSINVIDYKFCNKYYNTDSVDQINFLSKNNIKNLLNLNQQFDQNFNWTKYSKFCPHLNDEILIKKDYLDNIEQKKLNKQILNIIIIKTSHKSLESIFTDFANLEVTFSIITENKEDIEHYNIINYICKPHEQLITLNNILKNNKSQYFMIIYDYYNFEYNFINRIIKDLNSLNHINCLLLVQNTTENIVEYQNSTDFFRIKTDFLRKITEPYICIFNNEINSQFTYSISEVGIILYINQILNKYNSILATIDYIFHNNNESSNKLIIKDIITLFDLYISNIENDVINNYMINEE